ncbi:MAG TPA: hypothetical protein VFL85_00635 [Candidatus Saccharimonadales bacterium]|nr:hypothetical protein [Candidatus Saccharimonadales bacterium]
MAAELPTFTDELTGLPLSIAPVEGVQISTRSDKSNWHHHFHPSTSPVLVNTIGGRALRNSRVQRVDRNFHNYSPTAYHCFFKGPDIPEEEDEQFRMVVLACAGYIPEDGVDLSSGEPRRVRLSELQLQQLRQPGTGDEKQATYGYRDLRYSYDSVREFFSHYALTRRLDHMDPSKIDEFLHTKDEQQKRYLGHLLLAKKVEVAAEPMREAYKQIRAAGMLHPLMPPAPKTLVRYKLGRDADREKLFPRLEMQLSVFGS